MHLPIAIRAKRVSSRTVDGLSRLGDQFTFHARVITSIPATLKRYWREVARLVAQVAFGSGTLLAGGGSVVVIFAISFFAGSQIGLEGYRGLNLVGLAPLSGVMSAIAIEQVVEPYVRPKALQYLEEGKVVVFAAGTGNPFFTTDTAAALRGAEIGAEVVLKATKVDGIYTADPKKDPSATRYTTISFDEAIAKHLQVMDATAFALCRDQKLPIRVFSIIKQGALKSVVLGEDEGTLVHV